MLEIAERKRSRGGVGLEQFVLGLRFILHRFFLLKNGESHWVEAKQWQKTGKSQKISSDCIFSYIKFCSIESHSYALSRKKETKKERKGGVNDAED